MMAFQVRGMKVKNGIHVTLILLSLTVQLVCFAADKKFVILTASYNNIDYYKWNLDSVFDQTYENWELIYIDDLSTDGTREAVSQYIQKKGFQDKVRFVANTDKCYCLKNYYREIHKVPDDSIIVTLDGDDAFSETTALEYLNKIYSNPDVWYTYGNFDYYPQGSTELANPITLKPFPKEVVEDNSFREYDWNIHHLRSFYAGLFKKIKLEDLLYEGTFFPTAEDRAFMFPIIEQAGKHHAFIEKVLYHYNIGNPLITVKVWEKELRKNIREFVGGKEEYEPLSKPPYGASKPYSSRADVLIFNEHGPKNLRSCLASLKKVQGIAHTCVLLQQKELAEQESNIEVYEAIKTDYPKVKFISENDGRGAFDCFLDQSKERFTILMSDMVRARLEISVQKVLQQLEKTQAHMAYLHPYKSFLDNDEDPKVYLEEHVSAFQFAHFDSVPRSAEFFALYHTSDLKKKCRDKNYVSLRDIKSRLEKVNSQKIALVIN